MDLQSSGHKVFVFALARFQFRAVPFSLLDTMLIILFFSKCFRDGFLPITK